MTLDEELAEQYRTKGLKAALDDYAELKRRFYGHATYDFGEGSLNSFGLRPAGEKDTAGAIQVFKLNAETFPDSPTSGTVSAEAYMKSGDAKNAQVSYERALTLDPNNENAKEMLKKLKVEVKKE